MLFIRKDIFRTTSSAFATVVLFLALSNVNSPAFAEEIGQAQQGVSNPSGPRAPQSMEILVLPEQHSTDGVKKSTCTPVEPPQFPLPILTKEERETRLRFFMKDSPFHLVERSTNVDARTCNGLLQHLKSFNSVKVLEPAFSSYKPDPRVGSKIAPGCPHLDLDSEYYTDAPTGAVWWRFRNIYNQDPAFLAKPGLEKQSLSRAYVMATANFEYYDLSRYLGEGFWGYFAEGGVTYAVTDNRGGQVVQNTPPRLNFCNASNFETLAKLINVRTCKTVPDPYRPTNRIEHALYLNGPWGDYPTANVFAFIEIEGTLYRLNIEFAHPINDLAELIVPQRRLVSVFLDTFSNAREDSGAKYTCSFSTYANPGMDSPTPPGVTHNGE